MSGVDSGAIEEWPGRLARGRDRAAIGEAWILRRWLGFGVVGFKN